MTVSFWSEVRLEIPPELAETVAEIFQEEGAGGVVYEDPAILEGRTLETDEVVGAELLEKIPDRFALGAYFPVDDRLGERLAGLKRRIASILGYQPEFTLRQVQEEEWAEAWKSYFKPEHLGKIVIKPSWEDYSPVAGEMVVELDPGMAFGTGTHPTTRLCIHLLQEIITGPISVLDIGTGSGILALVAAKLGAAEIVATDIDPLAVQIARENIERNHAGDQVKVFQGNLLEPEIRKEYDLVVANIIANTILEMIPDLQGILKPGGSFLASGIIEERLPEILTILKQSGLTLIQTRVSEGWVAVWARKPN